MRKNERAMQNYETAKERECETTKGPCKLTKGRGETAKGQCETTNERKCETAKQREGDVKLWKGVAKLQKYESAKLRKSDANERDFKQQKCEMALSVHHNMQNVIKSWEPG